MQTHCPLTTTEGRKGGGLPIGPGLGLYSLIPSYLQLYLNRLFLHVDSLPPSTDLWPKGHEHPVLPSELMSQGAPAGWVS